MSTRPEESEELARSYLYVPGNRPDLLAKASRRGADALILDLEDAVPAAEKASAREVVGAHVARVSGVRPQVWVRVDQSSVAADIGTLHAAAAGIVVPKAEPDSLRAAARLLGAREEELGLPAGSWRIVALVETAAGVLDVREAARSPRVVRLAVGEVDLCAELGVDPDNLTALTPIRLAMVVASAAAGLDGPMAPMTRDFHDLDGLRASTTELRRTGFAARTCIHPAQVAVVNEVFTPTDEELAAARRLVDLMEAAEAAGRGTVIDEDGRMVDVAVVRRARRLLRGTGRS